jgi:hypothetical protein
MLPSTTGSQRRQATPDPPSLHSLVALVLSTALQRSPLKVPRQPGSKSQSRSNLLHQQALQTTALRSRFRMQAETRSALRCSRCSLRHTRTARTGCVLTLPRRWPQLNQHSSDSREETTWFVVLFIIFIPPGEKF